MMMIKEAAVKAKKTELNFELFLLSLLSICALKIVLQCVEGKSHRSAASKKMSSKS